MAEDQALLARAQSLREEIGHHNAALRQHRKERRAAQLELERLAATCRRLGIKFIIEPQHSEGAVYGPTHSDPRPRFTR